MLVPLSAQSKETQDTPQSLVPKGLAVPFFLVTALFSSGACPTT